MNKEELTPEELAELRKIFVPSLEAIGTISTKLLFPDKHLLIQIDGIFREMYLKYRANPQYVFVSGDLRQKISLALEEQYKQSFRHRSGLMQFQDDVDAQLPRVVVSLINPTTGRMTHVIALPKMTSSTEIIFGFFHDNFC